jgi:transcriptional regulator with XRE-family HTH domain
MAQTRTKTRRKKPEPLDPTRLIGEQVAKIRKARGMTQDGLAEAMQAVGIGWERVVIAKLEKGRRPFVKVDELLSLCLVLDITPVDLLIPRDLTDQPYRVTPTATAEAGNVREWVRGEDLLLTASIQHQGEPFTQPATVLDPIRWMPKDRAERVARRYFEESEK